MPIFEYRCTRCGTVCEFLEGVGSGRPEKRCSSCGSEDLERIFSASNVSTGGHFIGAQGGTTCCGREERCDTPPCGDGGVCER
jgi:putative FmdB family regulatory protein